MFKGLCYRRSQLGSLPCKQDNNIDAFDSSEAMTCPTYPQNSLPPSRNFTRLAALVLLFGFVAEAVPNLSSLREHVLWQVR
jgi:hypothetical protein